MTPYDVIVKNQQALFRDTSSSVSVGGRSPSDQAGLRHHHLLALGYEDENLIPSARGDDGAKRFFRERNIKWWKGKACADNFTTRGPTRNLTSSQVACVNFLYPLARHPQALATILRTLDADVIGVDVIDDTYLGLPPGPVEFEWVGLSQTLEGTKRAARGERVTSVDALMLGRLRDGGRRAYLFEWKLTEDYRSGPARGEGSEGETRRGRYTRGYLSATSPFNRAIPIDAWLFDPFYQIMRLLLLGQRMVDERELGVTDAVVVVVCPTENTEYRDSVTSARLATLGTTVEKALQAALAEPRRFRMTTQGALLGSLTREHGGGLEDWVAYQRERYGW